MALKGIRAKGTVQQYDYNYLANKPPIDEAPTEGSTNLVASGGVKAALDAKQGTLTFDNAPTAGSNNPVKSGGIKTALDAKQNNLTFDTTPTSGTTNPVTSDGIKTALDAMTGDSEFSDTSEHPVQNKVIKAALDGIDDAIDDINEELVDIDGEFDKVVHVDSASQGFTDQEKYNARFAIGAVGINDIGAQRFGVSGVGGSARALTRLYDAVGMTATPSTDLVAGSSDFDNYAPFNRKKCVGTWTVPSGSSKAWFTVNAYYGDADYAEDGTMGDYVAVEVDPFYYYDKDGILAVSTYPMPGYKIHPVCLDYDGNIRAHTYIPCYALAQDANGKAVSLPGYQNQRGGYKDLRDYAKTYADADAKAYAMIEPSAVWHYEWMLQTIEFATQDMQTVMYGAASMRYNNADTVTAVPGTNKVVLGATGSNFVIGQTILLYATYDQSVNVNLYNRITNIQKCDASGNVDSSGSYYLITYDGTDRSPAVGWSVTSRPWCTGATAGYAPGVNAILGHTGCPVHLTNGKYPMRYRWRENTYGNQNMTMLDLADVRVSEGNDVYHLEWYFLADPRKYMSYGNYDMTVLTDTSKGWVKLGVTTPAASYVSNYIKELGADPDYPWVKVPINTVGGSSSTYYCDYAYLVSSTEVRAVRRGGSVTSGAYAGPCFFTAHSAVSSAHWSYGAALYFLQ